MRMTSSIKVSSRLDKSASDIVIGVTKLAEIYDKSRPWARAILKKWLIEQENGGPIRVVKKNKRGDLYTTLAILQREMPPPRDQTLVRKLEEQERSITFMSRQIERLTTEVQILQRAMLPSRKY